jgi:hypothetical protein
MSGQLPVRRAGFLSRRCFQCVFPVQGGGSDADFRCGNRPYWAAGPASGVRSCAWPACFGAGLAAARQGVAPYAPAEKEGQLSYMHRPAGLGDIHIIRGRGAGVISLVLNTDCLHDLHEAISLPVHLTYSLSLRKKRRSGCLS